MSVVLVKYLPEPADRFEIGSDTHGYPETWYTRINAADRLHYDLHYDWNCVNAVLDLAVALAIDDSVADKEVKLVYPPVNPYESGE